MAYKKLILLAPCHGLEDFPLYHTGDDAESLLACWTALWHPLFLNSADRLPYLERCDYPSDDIGDALLVVPTPCDGELDSELSETAASKGSNLIRGLHQRSTILQQALEPYGDQAKDLDHDLVKDFMALGFAFLQVEVLTQQMRYASSIDQTRIGKIIKEAATAIIEGHADVCREKLTSCHDMLADERSHYYPVDVYFVDLTMLATAETTLGAALDKQLHENIPQNFMASGEVVEKLADFNPAALVTLRAGVESGCIGLAGGEYSELPLPLMSLDTAIRQLQRGRASYKKHLGQQPSCFARRKHGIYPSLSQVIHDAGYKSSLHIKFDSGQMPESSHGKTKWSLGGRELLDCYARAPLDASANESFLNLPSQLSETMDSDHVATRMFIHWPGQFADSYDDLQRCSRYGSALGKFVTLSEYFYHASDNSTQDEFQENDYVYSYLTQSVASQEPDPISTVANYWNRSVRMIAQRGMEAIASCLGAGHTPAASNSLEEQIDDGLDRSDELSNCAGSVADVIRHGLCPDNSSSRTIVNPFSFPRRIMLSSNEVNRATGPTVYATAKQSDGSQATLVDVPANGFAKVEFDGIPADSVDEQNLGEDLTLRNERFHATIDAETGALRSLKDYKSRKTRISQQVAFRITLPKTGQSWVDRQAPIAYSVMAADSVELTRNGPVFAEITAKGKMLALNGDPVGEFEQRYQVTRGSRVLVIEGEIKTVPEVVLDDPWDSYYACRFAFGDGSAVLRAGSHLQVRDVSRRRITAPLFVDIDCGNTHTTILTGGLPFHRRVADSQLDTLLSVVGEQSTHFRIGIGVDLPSMTRSAIDFMAVAQPATVLDGAAQTDSGWFFHIDAKNVIATWWQPLAEGTGVRVRLVETENKKSRVRIRSFKPWMAADQVDANGEVTSSLQVTDGVAELLVEPNMCIELQLFW